ncbi:DUF2470 domain-containing protein [Streptomyces sp. NPDC048182]|uniref:DUF2470 domain-containing protein n=1 Tax=Streptomyces sp. NPDC048182 TaxID=3365507 RepID=UPI00371D7793
MRRSPARTTARSTAGTTAPTAAERVRSILTTATSLTVVSEGVRTEVCRLGGEEALGHFHLHAPSDGAHVTTGPRVPVRLELTDVAPTPVRDRLRARVTLTGLLPGPYDPDSPKSACLEFGQAVLEDDGGRVFVTLKELQDAEPDPVAANEADLLTHLVDGHGELVPLLLRLVRPLRDRGVLRALPVGIDRYGLTLRIEYPDSHRDARLPFRTAVRHLDHIGAQLNSLLTEARRLAHPGRLLA